MRGNSTLTAGRVNDSVGIKYRGAKQAACQAG